MAGIEWAKLNVTVAFSFMNMFLNIGFFGNVCAEEFHDLSEPEEPEILPRSSTGRSST
jgi:hypothetical protein